jgi:anaerobic selenocysteine-containing dehydrogenase
LLIHPLDAIESGVENDQWAMVKSEVGEVRIKVEISDEMMPGTVSIPHGWGHDRKGIKMKVAQEHAGVSLNDLIDNDMVDPLCGVSIINGIPISIVAVA